MAFSALPRNERRKAVCTDVTGFADDIKNKLIKEKKSMKLKSKKSALLLSFTSLLLCFAMLAGSTFAWFTDTATTGVNQIKSGKLVVGLEMADGKNADDTTKWVDAEGKTLEFVKAAGAAENEAVLWEPNCTYKLPELRIVNKGNLALKYKVEITGIKGDAKLNDVIDWTIVEGETDNEVKKEGVATGEYFLLPAGTTTAPLTIKGHMDEKAGNEYQNLTIDGIGITVLATQYTYENDSFDDQYDANADYTIQVNRDNIQDYLDGKYGPIDGMTLVLADGDYGTLELGRATKYPGSNTQYRIGRFDAEPMTFDDFYATKNGSAWSGTPCYIRSMNNVTFKAAEGAEVKVAGVYAFSGHRYQAGYDYVLDREVVNGNNTYYMANRLTNITFDRITFTAKSDINTSIEQAIINGFTFKNCTFNIGHTEENSDYIALRYYNENNNGNVRNLVVDNCTFNECRQGVYTCHVYGVSVTNSIFNTTGHNAIAIQDFSGVGNHGKVVITNNTFSSIGDRIIRFNNVGADTQITIKNNTATNSGDVNKEVIKATSLASGIKYDISGNSWGEGKTVANTEFADK